ncbi:MAG: hypothetical protein KC589_03115 [Nanoarchaeota archaeon]|nr:hypothetical protein [Nanoarchaeota archaeon]
MKLLRILFCSLLFISNAIASPFLISDPYPALCCDTSNLPAECKQPYPTSCPLPEQCNLPENCIKNKPCGQPTSFSIRVDDGNQIDIPIVKNENDEPFLQYDVSTLTNANHTIDVIAKTSSSQSCPSSISFRKGRPSRVRGFYIQ